MTLIEFAAVVGALAWLPPIFTTVRNWLTRPQLRVITQVTPEIGFTVFGPILNLRVAFTVTHKDIVITGVRLLLTHESGERKYFSWQGIVQRMGVMTNSQTGPMPFEKELNVLAMKVPVKDVEERLIRFQNQDFLKHKADLEAISLKKMAYLRESNTFIAEQFLRCQEMSELYSYNRQSFSWKSGVYQLKFIIESPDSFTLLDNEYTFSLAPLNIQEISKNLNHIEQYYANEVLPLKEGEEIKKISWNWVYPEMQHARG